MDKFITFWNFLQTQPLEEGSDAIASGMDSLLSSLGLAGPALKIVGGVLILIIGFFIAKSVKGLIGRLLHKTGMDNRFSGDFKMSHFIASLIYYFLMIIVLMAALNIIGVGGEVLQPLNEMLSKFFASIPNIIVAGIILYIGYFLAKMISELVNFSGEHLKKWIPSIHVPENLDITKILKNVVFIFVFVPVAIIALDKLQMQPITEPATDMLGSFMAAIPMIIHAVIILLIVTIGGMFVKGLLVNLLDSLKVNSLKDKLQLTTFLGDTNLVKMLANIAYFFIIYFGVIAALEVLEMHAVVDILKEVLQIAGSIFFGLIILALGSFVANFVGGIYAKGENHNKFLLSVIKGAIIVLFLAMGLGTMGIADEIIQLAFGLGLGAIAVAFALAFGLGGREAAGKELEDFFKKFKI